MSWLTTAGISPARYSTTRATPTLATSARLGMITAGSEKSAARPMQDRQTSSEKGPSRIKPFSITPTDRARRSAKSATAPVQSTAASQVPRRSARRPPGLTAMCTQVPRSSSSATTGQIVTSSPSMQTASGTRA